MSHASVRVSLLGIELATIDIARVGAPGVDTDQQSAEAVHRHNLRPEQTPKGVPELLDEGIEGTATTVIEGECDRPAVRVELLVERVTGGWGFEQVTGGGDEDKDRGVPASRRAPSEADPVARPGVSRCDDRAVLARVDAGAVHPRATQHGRRWAGSRRWTDVAPSSFRSHA